MRCLYVSLLFISVCTKSRCSGVYQRGFTKPEKVEELFDYCQILEAYITKKGWQFLIENYGYDRLYEIDKRSGWLTERSSESSIEEYIEWVKYEIGISKEE